MSYKQYLTKLEHRKYKRFTQSFVEALESVQNLLYKDEQGKAIEGIKGLINGFKMDWCDFEKLSDEQKKAYEDLAREILESA